jgi:hypothetical protein
MCVSVTLTRLVQTRLRRLKTALAVVLFASVLQVLAFRTE